MGGKGRGSRSNFSLFPFRFFFSLLVRQAPSQYPPPLSPPPSPPNIFPAYATGRRWSATMVDERMVVIILHIIKYLINIYRRVPPKNVCRSSFVPVLAPTKVCRKSSQTCHSFGIFRGNRVLCHAF